MISVPNHLQPLSGNNFIFGVLFLGILVSCATPKPATVPTTRPSQPSPPLIQEEQVKIFDPITGTYILVPKSDVKVDTVEWSADPNPPLVTDTEVKPEKPVSKKQFNISLLIPFTSTSQYDISDHLDSKLNRWLQYYAGVQLASEELNGQGFTFKVSAHEAGETNASTEILLQEQVLAEADVIIGPYVKEGIERTAAFGLKNESMVISPWLPAFTIARENPYFIQALPGLNTHADAISSFLADKCAGKKIFLVARNIPSDINRLNLFKKNSGLKTEDLIIDDATADLYQTTLKKLLAPEGTVFVLPYFAKSDESFVNSFLRKLHAEKELEDIMVVGFPQWMGFSNLNANYMESLSVHLSVSTFTDIDHPAYETFRIRFFNRFHIIPEMQAFLGYDLMKWIASTLKKGGKEGLISPLASWKEGMASGFDIRPVYKTDTSSGSEMKTPLYYENAYIRIIRYKDLDYHLVR